MFYNYVYLREDGTPYYVGKGKGNRAYAKHGAIHVPPIGRIVFYIAKDEADAFETEIALIWYYGRKDLGLGCLRNLSDGGENPPKTKKGRVFSKEHREKISRTLKKKGIMPPSRIGVPHRKEIRDQISHTMKELRRSQ